MDRRRPKRHFWRPLLRRLTPDAEAEIRAELELYVELRTEELAEQGVPRDIAAEQARTAFGDAEEVLGECLGLVTRGVWNRRKEEMLGSLIRDLKFAIRTLRRSPRFVLAVCTTLALGIGANSAIFSVLDAVALRPLPYPAPDRLYRVWTQYPRQGNFEFAVSNAEYLDYAAESELFETMGAFAVLSRTLTEHGPARRLAVAFTSAPVWELVGAQPLLGRTFGADDDHPDAPGVAVLSHETWSTVFAAATDVVGQQILLNDNPATIIGVMAADFLLPEAPADIFMPLGLDRDRIVRRDGHYLTVFGRAAPGVDLMRIRAEMRVVNERWDAEYNHAHPLDAEPLMQDIVGDARTPLIILFAAVGLVLIIGCANVAGLMMARAMERQREMAIRTAIGATRGQIMRQLLIEGVVLASIGGTLGLVLAAVGLPALLGLEPGDLPRLGEVSIDARVVAFTLLLSTLSGVLFALVPALRASSRSPAAVLGGGRGSADPSRQRFLRGLVLTQVAVALVLVAGATVLTQSLTRLLQVDPGLRTDGVVAARVTATANRYRTPEEIRGFFDRLRADLGAIPGVRAVGGVRSLPLAEGAFMENFLKDDEHRLDPDAERRFEYQMVTDGYFDAAGVDIVAGRGFAPTDLPTAPRVAIVNEALVRQNFQGEEVVGQRIWILASNPNTEEFEIVGIARDVLQDSLDSPAPAQIYVPHAQATEYVTGATRSLAIAVRTEARQAGLAEAIRDTVWDLDPDLAVTNVRSMESVVWNAVARPRFLALLLGLLAALALVLAGIGVYSVISYGVAQRTREFGIRLALGALPGEVVRMVLVQGMRPVLIGLGVGLIAALATGSALSAVLFQTSSRDPLTLLGVAVGLLLIAALAAWLPARRVSRIETMEALGSE